MDNQMNNNMVYLSGKIIEKPKFSHEVYGEEFYDTILEIPRLSGQNDYIPITISVRLMSEWDFSVGNDVSVGGQFRSYNKLVDGKSKLMLTVFVREIMEYYDEKNPNQIDIFGYVCKEPIFRTTPFKREICDILIAVNRAYNKSDYIPCISWGRNARYSSGLEVGTPVVISGRIQSREYQKTLQNGEIEVKTAYEISINRINTVEESEL